MENKYYYVKVCIIAVFIVVTVVAFLLTAENEYILYIRVFLLLFVVQTFAVLRLYNSVVANSTIQLKLRTAIVKLQQSLTSVERSFKTLTVSVQGLKSSMEALKRAEVDSSEKLGKLTDTIRKS